MNNNQEILCNKCVHREVCTYKDDYLTVLKAVLNGAFVHPCSDGKEFDYKAVKDFDFIKDINVECKYYQNREVNFYGTK